MPRILAGSSGAIAMTSLAEFGIRAGDATEAAARSFESMYADAGRGALQATAQESFEAVRIVRSPPTRRGSRRTTAPCIRAGRSASRCEQIAQLIKADVGLEVAFTDVGGWDTHAGEGGGRASSPTGCATSACAIAAFASDLGSRMADVTLVTMSEFGRTVRENGNRGTDHGHANVHAAPRRRRAGRQGLRHAGRASTRRTSTRTATSP